MKNRECPSCGYPVIGDRNHHESICKYRLFSSDSLSFVPRDLKKRTDELSIVSNTVRRIVNTYTVADCDNIPRLL